MRELHNFHIEYGGSARSIAQQLADYGIKGVADKELSRWQFVAEAIHRVALHAVRGRRGARRARSCRTSPPRNWPSRRASE